MEDLDGAPVPPKPTGWVIDRMDIKNFRCKVSQAPWSLELSVSCIQSRRKWARLH